MMKIILNEEDVKEMINRNYQVPVQNNAYMQEVVMSRLCKRLPSYGNYGITLSGNFFFKFNIIINFTFEKYFFFIFIVIYIILLFFRNHHQTSLVGNENKLLPTMHRP